MKRLNSSLSRLPAGLGWLIIAVVVWGAAGCTTDSGGTVAGAKTETRRPLTGAELYAVNCNRCHPERSPDEWQSAEWATILTHMRVRANLPAAQARTILKYLRENSGN